MEVHHNWEKSLSIARDKFEVSWVAMPCLNQVVIWLYVWPLIIGIQVMTILTKNCVDLVITRNFTFFRGCWISISGIHIGITQLKKVAHRAIKFISTFTSRCNYQFDLSQRSETWRSRGYDGILFDQGMGRISSNDWKPSPKSMGPSEMWLSRKLQCSFNSWRIMHSGRSPSITQVISFQTKIYLKKRFEICIFTFSDKLSLS